MNLDFINNIGIKYIGLSLSKFIKLIYLKMNLDFINNIGIKYIGLSLSKLIKLTKLNFEIL